MAIQSGQLRQACERGSVLVLSSFLLLIITLITVSYWKLIEMRLLLAGHKEQEMRAYFAARAGLDDAISELVQGHKWDSNEPGLHEEWQFVSDSTFYKSNANGEDLSFFSYPVTFSATIVGDIDLGSVTINSVGEVSKSRGDRIYSKRLEASVIRSFNGDFLLSSMTEISDG